MIPNTVETLEAILAQDLRLAEVSIPTSEECEQWGLRRRELFQLLQVESGSALLDSNMIAPLVAKISDIEQIILDKLEQNLASLADEIQALALVGRRMTAITPGRSVLLQRIA